MSGYLCNKHDYAGPYLCPKCEREANDELTVNKLLHMFDSRADIFERGIIIRKSQHYMGKGGRVNNQMLNTSQKKERKRSTNCVPSKKKRKK